MNTGDERYDANEDYCSDEVRALRAEIRAQTTLLEQEQRITMVTLQQLDAAIDAHVQDASTLQAAFDKVTNDVHTLAQKAADPNATVDYSAELAKIAAAHTAISTALAQAQAIDANANPTAAATATGTPTAPTPAGEANPATVDAGGTTAIPGATPAPASGAPPAVASAEPQFGGSALGTVTPSIAPADTNVPGTASGTGVASSPSDTGTAPGTAPLPGSATSSGGSGSVSGTSGSGIAPGAI